PLPVLSVLGLPQPATVRESAPRTAHKPNVIAAVFIPAAFARSGPPTMAHIPDRRQASFAHLAQPACAIRKFASHNSRRIILSRDRHFRGCPSGESFNLRAPMAISIVLVAEIAIFGRPSRAFDGAPAGGAIVTASGQRSTPSSPRSCALS